MAGYDIIYSTELKAEDKTKQVQDNVADHAESMSDNPIYKVIVPQYMYKPAWGFPRFQPLGLLRSLGKNVYASSIFKTIKDLIIDTPWDIVPKDGVEMTDELQEKIDKYKLFFKKPNPDPGETYATFTRKILDDTFKYDSGVINKIFNQFGEMIQMRAAAGDTFKKNPNKHGYLDEREDLILIKGEMAGKVPTNEFINSSAFQFYTSFIDSAAYFQFVNSVASQIPIPFGKREICWLTTNPSTDNVYTNGAPLEDAIDIVLTLVYGSKYNLDFYANGNTPEGIINAVGATKRDLKKIKDQLNLSVNSPRDRFGLKRRIGFRNPVMNMDNIEFVKLNLNSQEMEILNQQQWFTKILWMRFGVNPDMMGFTENSNRATSTQQTGNAMRKAVKPFFTMLEECYTYEILTEFEDGDLLRFKFDFHDAIEQKILRELQQLEIDMGINTWQKIADEEGLDVEELKKHKEDNMGMEFEVADNFNNDNEDDKAQAEKDVDNNSKTENKSFTADIGGEGTTDSVLNPIEKPRKKKKVTDRIGPLVNLGSIVKRGDQWCVVSRDGSETLGCHNTKEDAINQLQAVEANKAEHKANEYRQLPSRKANDNDIDQNNNETNKPTPDNDFIETSIKTVVKKNIMEDISKDEIKAMLKEMLETEFKRGSYSARLDDKDMKANSPDAVTSSLDVEHTHTIAFDDRESSAAGADPDAIHVHEVDHVNYKLLAGEGSANHTHDFPTFHVIVDNGDPDTPRQFKTDNMGETIEVKADDDDKTLPTRKQKELVMESPLEKVMAAFIKKVDKKNLEIEKDAKGKK